MPRKVFISFLGTGFYNECKYQKGDFISSRTRFVQQAMLEYYDVKSWNEDCCTVFLLTDKARRENWDIPDGKRKKSPSAEEEDYSGLHEIVTDMALRAQVREVRVPEGKDEQEIWNVFITVYEQLEEGDELYLDITHGLRYLPMFMLVLSNYARFLKKTNVVAVSYGSFETRNIETNVTPIVDLMPLVQLQQWTYAAGQYLDNGYAGSLNELCEKGLKPLLENSDTRDKQTSNLRCFIKYLDIIAEDCRMCRGIPIVEGGNVKTINSAAKDMESGLITPLAPIIGRIMKSLSGFKEGECAENGFRAALWCLDNGMYQQAVTIANENIVTAICIEMDLDWKTKAGRDLVSIALSVTAKEIQESDWDLGRLEDDDDDVMEERKKNIRKIIDNSEHLNRFRPVYRVLNETIRNDINHSGMRSSYMKAPQLKDKISKQLKRLEELMGNEAMHKPASPKPHLFLNVSNHPSSEWGEPQLSAAKQYGDDICDMPFPPVEPEATEDEIKDLAENLCSEILTLAKENEVTVHIMGEMGLTFCIVERLRGYGIRCLHSTTYRLAETLPDGSKYVRFDFNQFREYTD